MSKKRTYLDSYVQYGFDFVVVDGVEKPQCLLCLKVLGNGSLKPSILKQHLEASHPVHASDDRATFESKRARFRAEGTLPKLGFVSEKKPMLAASYNVALRIAKAKKPHDIAEKLIKPCALDMVEHVGLKQSRWFKPFPFLMIQSIGVLVKCLKIFVNKLLNKSNLAQQKYLCNLTKPVM